MKSAVKMSPCHRTSTLCHALIVLFGVAIFAVSGSIWSTEYRHTQYVVTATADDVTTDRPVRAMTSRQRRNVKREILAVLGLDHVPRPAMRSPRDLAVAEYMMSLYRTAVQTTGSDVITNTVDASDQPTLMEKIQLDAADTIISFTDHGMYRPSQLTFAPIVLLIWYAKNILHVSLCDLILLINYY